MSFGVGITMMKMSPKLSSKAGGKHSGNLAALAYEALEERRCKDPDLNPEMTKYNIYQGIRKASELVPTMMAEAEDYSKKRQAAGGRALRDTASIGFATIVKPDSTAVMAMSPEDRKRFFTDSNEILDEILGADNVRSRVRHVDEAADHEHTFRMGFTPSGELSTAYFFKPQLFRKINVDYPKAMRERGWDVKDCDVLDLDRMDDEEYMEERRQKRKRYGRDSRKFKEDEIKERESRLTGREVIFDMNAKISNATMDSRKKDLDARERALDDREKALDEAFQKARQELIDDLKAERDKMMAEADKDRREAAEALQDAQRAAQDILDRARTEADRIWDEAGKDVKKYKGYAEIGKKISEKARKSDKEKQRSTAKPTEKRKIVSKNRIYSSLSQKRGAEADAFLGIGAEIGRQTEDFEKN